MQDIDRRTTLGLLASSGLSALAGCAVLGGSASVAYADWMPGRDENYTVIEVDADAVLDADVSSAVEDTIKGDFLDVSSDVLEIEDIEGFASAPDRGTVCTYTIDEDDLVADLEDAVVEDADAPDPPEGYEAFAGRRMLYWLGDDYLLAARDPEFLQGLYDTNQGDADAYAESDVLRGLDDQLEADDIVILTPIADGSIPGATGGAYAWGFDDDTVDLEIVLSFENVEAAESAAEDEYLTRFTEDGPFEEYEDVKTTVDDRFNGLRASTPVDEFDLLSSDSSSQPTAPLVSFSFEYADGGDGEWNGDDEERVVIQHDGGDVFDVTTVSIRVAGTPVSESAGIESDKPESGQMRAGDQWTLRPTSADSAFESGTDIILVWESPEGDTVQIIAESTLP